GLSGQGARHLCGDRTISEFLIFHWALSGCPADPLPNQDPRRSPRALRDGRLKRRLRFNLSGIRSSAPTAEVVPLTTRSLKSDGLEDQSRPADARQQPSHDSAVRRAAAALKLVLLDGTFGEGRGLIHRLSLVLRKRHPLANDFPTRLAVFHVCGSLGCNFSTRLERMLESRNRLHPRQLRIKVADQSFRIMRICPI